MGPGQSQDGFFHCLPAATHARKETARTGTPWGTARLRLCTISGQSWLCWRENHCTAASAQGSQGLIPAAIRHPGESPTAGTGSPGNEPSPLLQGIFQFRADSRGFYVSNLHYMSLLSLITCQAGEPVSGSGSTGLTLGRVSGEAASAGKCTVLSLPYL